MVCLNIEHKSMAVVLQGTWSLRDDVSAEAQNKSVAHRQTCHLQIKYLVQRRKLLLNFLRESVRVSTGSDLVGMYVGFYGKGCCFNLAFELKNRYTYPRSCLAHHFFSKRNKIKLALS